MPKPISRITGARRPNTAVEVERVRRERNAEARQQVGSARCCRRHDPGAARSCAPDAAAVGRQVGRGHACGTRTRCEQPVSIPVAPRKSARFHNGVDASAAILRSIPAANIRGALRSGSRDQRARTAAIRVGQPALDRARACSRPACIRWQRVRVLPRSPSRRSTGPPASSRSSLRTPSRVTRQTAISLSQSGGAEIGDGQPCCRSGDSTGSAGSAVTCPVARCSTA